MSKIKKLLCVMLLIAMCIPYAAFAADAADTYYINENFNASTGEFIPGISNWRDFKFTANSGLDNGLSVNGTANNTSVAKPQLDVVKGSKSFTFKNIGSAQMLRVSFGSDDGHLHTIFRMVQTLNFHSKQKIYQIRFYLQQRIRQVTGGMHL